MIPYMAGLTVKSISKAKVHKGINDAVALAGI